jgi:hypothetical protein
VGDRDHRALVAREDLLERFARREIEMIRRLVEHEQVRVADRESREREPRALAAGEDPDAAEHLLAAEEEAGENAARALLVEATHVAQRFED